MIQFKVKSSTLKKGFFCLFVPTVLFHTKLTAQPAGYTYGKSIKLKGSQITGALSNFPVLISFIDPALKTTAFAGGRLQNANGYDVIFTLQDCNTVLPMQLEKYTAATGEYVACATGNTGPQKYTTQDNGVYFLNVYLKDIKHTRKILIAQ